MSEEKHKSILVDVDKRTFDTLQWFMRVHGGSYKDVVDDIVSGFITLMILVLAKNKILCFGVGNVADPNTKIRYFRLSLLVNSFETTGEVFAQLKLSGNERSMKKFIEATSVALCRSESQGFRAALSLAKDIVCFQLAHPQTIILTRDQKNNLEDISLSYGVSSILKRRGLEITFDEKGESNLIKIPPIPKN